MAVNGGAGNAISFSEIQTFYGGSNPISISEYYRGGDEVPGDQVAAQSNTSGTTDQTVGQFTVDVTTTSGYTGSLVTQSTTIAPITVAADTAFVNIINIHEDKDGGSSTKTIQVFINGSSIGTFTTVDGTGNGANITAAQVAGPANNGAISGNDIDGTASAGQTITVSATGQNHRISETTRSLVTTHDVDFRNNSAITITTTSGSTGGAQTYTQNQTRKVKNDQSTPNWTLGYNAVLGNTNVPASGAINLDVFNAPGNPTP